MVGEIILSDLDLLGQTSLFELAQWDTLALPLENAPGHNITFQPKIILLKQIIFRQITWPRDLVLSHFSSKCRL